MDQKTQTPHPGGQFSHILSQFYDYLHLYQDFGFEGIPRSAHTPPQHPSPSSLDELELISQNCQACMRHKGRTHLVFGSGNPRARLMFIGEAPSAEDDRQGVPFTGEAGALLTRIIEAIKLRREDIYLTSILKCHSSTERPPEGSEIDQCAEILQQQIDLIRPKIICALGPLAAQSLLDTYEPITRLRGRFHHYHGILVMPTYHPAHLLKHPEDKRQVWHDIQMVQRIYEE